MKAQWFAKFALLAGLALLTILMQGEGWLAAAQSPQATSCNNAFEPVHQWGSTGSGSGQFRAPVAIAVDWNSDIHVADRDNGRIQKFNPLGSYLLEYGNGYTLSPSGVEAGYNIGYGYMYVTDPGHGRIRYYDLSGGFIGSWDNSECGSQCYIREPWGVAGWGEYPGSGNIYVADRYSCQIMRFSPSGQQVIGKWGSSCNSEEWLLSSPQDVATYFNDPPNIFLYIADTGNNRIAKYDYQLNWLFNWGTAGTADGQFNQPSSVATDADGCVYVADTGNHRIQVFDDQGGFVAKFGSQGSGPGQFQSPRGVAVGGNGCIYVADTGNNRVVVFCPQPPPPPDESVDAFIRDNIIDTGIIPSVKPWWESPDVWIRHAPDGQEFPESPILGQTNYIYIQVRNLGNILLDNVEAAVYCAPPSEAPPPDAWTYIGSIHLSGIAPQSKKTGHLSWNPGGDCLQILENDNHMCLLVRLITDQDPIQNEGSAPWDNNIAQLNVHQFKNWPDSGNLNAAATLDEDVTFLIGNPFDTFQMADVEFDRSDFPAGGQLEVYLDEILFDQWQAASGTVEGGMVNLTQKKIDFTSTPMGVIKGLPLDAKQQFSTTMRVTAASDQFFSIAVSERINGDYVGGNLYTTNFASHPEMVDLSAPTNIMVPNSTQTISAIVFGSGKMPVRDGTIVNFSTTLGILTANQVTTVGGIAKVQLVAGEIRGTAQVSASANSIASTPLKISIGNLVYLPLVVKGSQ